MARLNPLLGLQSRFGDKLLGIVVVSPRNGTAVLQGLNTRVITEEIAGVLLRVQNAIFGVYLPTSIDRGKCCIGMSFRVFLKFRLLWVGVQSSFSTEEKPQKAKEGVPPTYIA